MIPTPDLNFTAVMPLLVISVGTLVVILGEILLAGRETFLGRAITREWVGSVLAIVSAVFLGAVVILACQHFFNTGRTGRTGHAFHSKSFFLKIIHNLFFQLK